MELVSRGKDVQLKLALMDTDLLDILRHSKSPQFLENSSARPRPRGKSDVFACYSTRDGNLTLTGILHNRLPYKFVLKPGTRSYGNIIRYLLGELRSLSRDEHGGCSGSMSSDCRSVLEGLRSSLEGKLSDLDRATQARVCDISGIVEVFRSDFEKNGRIFKEARLARPRKRAMEALSEYSGRSIIRNREPRERQFRLFVDDRQAGPQLISGFLNLEIEEFPRPAEEASRDDALRLRSLDEILHAVRSSLRFHTPILRVQDTDCDVTLRFEIDPGLLKYVDLYLHWGRNGNGSSVGSVWIDEEVAPEDVTEDSLGKYTVRKRIASGEKGRFGLTACVVIEGTRERIWAAESGVEDVKFQVGSPLTNGSVDQIRLEIIEDISAKGRILQSLATYEQFVRTMSQLVRAGTVRGLGRLLFDLTKDNIALRTLVSEYYQRIVLELEQGKTTIPKSKLRTTVEVLKYIGIGEVVFVAPEGPHAVAGGLAQVVVGLTKALTRCGISCTVITPLYEEAQGNKHASAETLLSEGVRVLDKRVPIRKIGNVRIPVGPTCRWGTSETVEFPRVVRASVYMAENEGLRIIFLRHRKLANRLYASGWGDDQIRRALFLSRGALEVVRDRRFNVTPHIMVTNDWPTALVPVLLRADPTYLGESRLNGVESIHIMHNCGQSYQGRFPVNQFGEDLWPMLGISGEHFFGLRDPEECTLLNLTAGAAFHSGKALVAVSKPYAEQLLTDQGGEGLNRAFSQNGNVLFGISNGIDVVALRNLFWRMGEKARNELGMVPLIRSRFSPKRLIRKLPEYKRATKLVVQQKYSLREDPEAILVSLVGRLAEQKGVQLLSGTAWGDQVSVIEAVLQAYPQVQFFLGGPPTMGEPVVREFRRVVEELTARYPGRIRGEFDFIPHQAALEITEASDLFLMPSRYEPGGITQLEALASGTLVVARNVGGIAATLVNFSPNQTEGNSFLFRDFSSTALKDVLCHALEVIKDEAQREMLVMRAANAENDWSHRAPKYISIMQYVAGVFESRSYYAHLAPRWHLLNSLRAV